MHLRNRQRILPILFATLLLDMVSIGIIFPVLATIFADPQNPSFLLHEYPQNSWLFIAGLVGGVFGVMQFIAAPLLGELSDIYGRKKLLLVGVAALALSQFVMGFGILSTSLTTVAFARAFAGLAAANFAIAQAAIADVSSPEDRAKNFGLIGAALGLGFIIGPLLGGLLSQVGNASTPFWFAGVLGIINCIFVHIYLHETRIPRVSHKYTFTLLKGVRNVHTALTDIHLRSSYLTSFIYMFGFNFFTAFSGIYLVEQFGLSPGGVGTYFAITGISIAITQVAILPRITKKYSERVILTYSLPVLAFAFCVYILAPNASTQYLIIPLIAVPQGLSVASILALISTSVSSETQGVVLGVNGSLTALGSGLAPILGGGATVYFGNTAPFYIAAGACVVAWWTLRYINTDIQTHAKI